MRYETKIIALKNGQEAVLRSPCKSEGAQMMEFLKTLSSETEFILRYPEESPRAISERILWNATARYGEYERDDMTVVTLQVV